MDRPAFEHLYLHANSIVTLAFLRSMVRLIAMQPPQRPRRKCRSSSPASSTT